MSKSWAALSLWPKYGSEEASWRVGMAMGLALSLGDPKHRKGSAGAREAHRREGPSKDKKTGENFTF